MYNRELQTSAFCYQSVLKTSYNHSVLMTKARLAQSLSVVNSKQPEKTHIFKATAIVEAINKLLADGVNLLL